MIKIVLLIILKEFYNMLNVLELIIFVLIVNFGVGFDFIGMVLDKFLYLFVKEILGIKWEYIFYDDVFK